MEFEIKPNNKLSLGLKELNNFRELFYFFTWRDIKVKYKQTVLGFLWVIIQPLLMTTVFTYFLGSSIKLQTNLPIPYPLFALSGMLLWTVFSNCLVNAANSMVNNANIIKKIYFPRLIIPISSVLVGLFDFAVSLIVFIISLVYFNTSLIPLSLIYIPLSLLLVCISTIGGGAFLAALNIKYRDVRYIIPFFMQALLFLTPVLYPSNFSQNSLIQTILKLNPISGPLEIFRASFSNYTPDLNTIVMSASTSILLFVIGIIYFRKTESYFADLA